MIEIRRSTKEDIYAAFKLRKECFGQGDDSLHGMLNCLDRGVTYTLTDSHGNIGCVLGFVLIWNGVASCGAITTNHIAAHPIGYTRAVHDLIALGMSGYNIHRAEITVQDDFTAGHKWARTIGFIPEARLEKYGPDKKDHILYGRVI